jgi:O-antigen/teichoic acid export membrane protein
MKDPWYSRFIAIVLQKGSLLNLGALVLASKALAGGMNWLSTVLIIREISERDFGFYTLIASYLGFFQVFLGGFDASIIRFGSQPSSAKSIRSRIRIYTTVAVIKGTLFLLLIPIFFLARPLIAELSHSNQGLDVIFNDLYLTCILIIGISGLRTTISSIHASLLRYTTLFTVNTLAAAATLSGVVIILQQHQSILAYAHLLVVVHTFAALLFSLALLPSLRRIFRVVRLTLSYSSFRRTFNNHIRAYSLPLNLVGLIAYFKQNLPSLLVGSQIGLESLTIFTVVRQITGIPHKLIDNLLEQLYPKLFVLAEQENPRYRSQYRSTLIGGFLIRVLFGLGLIAALPLLGTLYGIDLSGINLWVGIILIVDFIVGYFLTVGRFLLMLNTSTAPVAIAASSRLVTNSILTVTMIWAWGLIGAALSLLTSTLISLVVMTKLGARFSEGRRG